MGGRVSVQMTGNSAAPGTGHMNLIIDACIQHTRNFGCTNDPLLRETILDLTQGWVTYICISQLCFRQWPVANSVPKHHLNQR